jgi:putative addiction module killer protein
LAQRAERRIDAAAADQAPAQGARRKAQLGNLGDVAPVGERVYEMREHFGPGWRMYFVQRDSTLLVMLGGGDKSTQQADISKAIDLSK